MIHFLILLCQIFSQIQSLHPFEKFCLRTLLIAINVPVAICQFINFVHLEKGLLRVQNFQIARLVLNCDNSLVFLDIEIGYNTRLNFMILRYIFTT